ncbi:hypothetical protein HK096_003752 [Nowakowskiella sp. JEL0078]|nr:hypothetical protein HK096_003752 [Nowakowskiella sp. JEL0078]
MNEYFEAELAPTFAGALNAELKTTKTTVPDYYYSKDKSAWVRIIKACAIRHQIDLLKKAVIEGAKLRMDILTNKRRLDEILADDKVTDILKSDLEESVAQRVRVSKNSYMTNDDAINDVAWDITGASPTWFNTAKLSYLDLHERLDTLK